MEKVDDKICLDTDVLVNFLRNKKEETDFITKHEGNILFVTTYINLFELYYGAFKSSVPANVARVEELQHRLKILNLSKPAVEKAGRILANLERTGTPIDFRDLLIGCIAHTEGFCIKTRNKKHFERIEGLLVK